MEERQKKKQSHIFDNIRLEKDSDSDGSIADIEDDHADNTESSRRKKKVKRKKIHFRSDFVKDESSSSDEENVEKKTTFAIQEKNPGELTWPMWCWYYVVHAAVGSFHAAEYCGEKLADLFGITSPKYQYVINEYHRLRQEEQEEEKAEEREREHTRKREVERLAELEGGIDTLQTSVVT